jgi:N-acetyl sugar amidotransferase
MGTQHDSSIDFDDAGVCSHCQRFDKMRSVRMVSSDSSDALSSLVQRIARAGRGRDYDCVAGVSGGVDSTYLVALLKLQGLRVLAVHFDNGWNSELAVSNIEGVLKGLDIDLATYVVNWDEFRELQIAFLRASTPDGEIPTDHGVFASLWHKAAALGIRYVASGMNFATESSSVPDWAYGHLDWRYIKDVNRVHGKRPLLTFPHFSLRRLAWWNVMRGMRWVSPLNCIDYKREEAVRFLSDSLGWRDYGGKHHESIYTRFYQSWYLPAKFGIDKRVIHLSDMIRSGQLTRAAALETLREPPVTSDVAAQDREYVVKKLGLNDKEFAQIFATPRRSYRDFRNNASLVRNAKLMLNLLRGLGAYER